MLTVWYIFFTLSGLIAKYACNAHVINEISEEIVDNNIISSGKLTTKSFTSYVPQCWSYQKYVPFQLNEQFKSHFNVVIPHGGPVEVEYETGETCGVVKVVCLLPISNRTVNDPHIYIDTCENLPELFNIPIGIECIPAVQCQTNALHNTKIILTLTSDNYRPLTVVSLSGEEIQYNGIALAEGRRTQALLTEHDVGLYRERADALNYASNVDSIQDEYDRMAGIDKSEYKCLEIQAWRAGPGGAPAANLPICPTAFLRTLSNSSALGYHYTTHLAICNDDGLISGEFLTPTPATSWALLHEVAHIYDALVADNYLEQSLNEVWNNVLAGLYQARYAHKSYDHYWLYRQMAEVNGSLDVLRADVTFGDLSLRERAHVLIGLLNVDNDSSYVADLYKRYYTNDGINNMPEELVNVYLNRRLDPLPLMSQVFSGERGYWFNITQFAQAISLNRRLSYHKDVNTFPRSKFSVTSAPVKLKTNVSFSPESCDTPYFTVDGILFNRTTVVSKANSLIVCLDAPNIVRSVTNLTKFTYLTDMNAKQNIEGLKFHGFANTWGHLDIRHDENKVVFETYNMQPHSLFDTVYAIFTFVDNNDEIMWQVSIQGNERRKRHKELNLSEVKKIEIFYEEPFKLKNTQSQQAFSNRKNSTFIINLSNPYFKNNIFNPMHIMASEGLTFNGYSNIWGFLDLRYDVNKLVFKTLNKQPHSLFDIVYAGFRFFNLNDDLIWEVFVKGTETQIRHKEFNLSEVKKVEMFYLEPDKLKNKRTKLGFSNSKNSTVFIKRGCGFAETIGDRVDHFERDLEHFVSVNYLSKFVDLFKQNCVN